jgi:hypothetical protein
MGYDFKQVDPAWFDVLRPTRLPNVPNQFGRDGNFFAGVRQTRFGVKNYFPTDLGELKTIFEFELFGTGVDAGQTTFRLRHAWGELGQFGGGQTWSPFMDPDVFPNSLEYWGPNGMVFFRNVQFRWMPINNGNNQLVFAAERPGASGDAGILRERIQLQNVTPRFPVPDLSAHVRFGGERGHVQIAGIGRYIGWDDNVADQFDLGGHTWGWGVNVSSLVPFGKKDALKLEATYGEGIQNYMNDAPIDIAPTLSFSGNPRRPIVGEALPLTAFMGFYDRQWSEKWSSSFGYSYLKMDNTSLQTLTDFHKGEYSLFNLLYYPTKNSMIGGEFQWGRRQNINGFEEDDYRIQFSTRFNFSHTLVGENK